MNRATFGLWGTSLPIAVVGLGGIIYVGFHLVSSMCVHDTDFYA
jgi:hypothetical protein